MNNAYSEELNVKFGNIFLIFRNNKRLEENVYILPKLGEFKLKMGSISQKSRYFWKYFIRIKTL